MSSVLIGCRDISNFTNILCEQTEQFIDELQLSKQDNVLTSKKLEQLENRVGSLHNTEQIQSEKQRFLNNEVENYKTQKH